MKQEHEILIGSACIAGAVLWGFLYLLEPSKPSTTKPPAAVTEITNETEINNDGEVTNFGLSNYTRYTSIEKKISELGIAIDEKNSKFVEGSTKIAIHLQDPHGYIPLNELKQARIKKGLRPLKRSGVLKSQLLTFPIRKETNYKTLDTLLSSIEVDGIGLESFVGSITSPDKIRKIRERVIQSEKEYKRERTILIEESARYLASMEFFSDDDFTANSRRIVLNIAAGVSNSHVMQSSSEVLDPYVVELFDRKPLFGLENENHYELAKHYAHALFLDVVMENAENFLTYLTKLAPKYKRNYYFSSMQEGVERWAVCIRKALESHLTYLHNRGITSLSKQDSHQYVIGLRNQDWTAAIARQEGSVFVTVGEAEHTFGYSRALVESGISVIALKRRHRQVYH